jgi:VWFA-related protein
LATDSNGRFDPTVTVEDLLVLEDGQPQEIRSIHRTPASVVLLLDTGGVRNPGMKTNATRDFAMRLVSQLRAGDQVSTIQFGGKVELIQSWTADRDLAIASLLTRLFSGQGGRLSRALSAAATQLKLTPSGNRHVVLVTDGGELPAAGEELGAAMTELYATQATIHVVSYTALGRKAINKSHPTVPVKITNKKPKSANDLADEIMHPNDPMTLAKKSRINLYLVLDVDFPLRRRYRDQLKILKQNEPLLEGLAEETGGNMSLPSTTADLPLISDNLAREIDAQYVITYRPKTPVTSETSNQVRQIEVVSRRVGLVVNSRRSYLSSKQ